MEAESRRLLKLAAGLSRLWTPADARVLSTIQDQLAQAAEIDRHYGGR